MSECTTLLTLSDDEKFLVRKSLLADVRNVNLELICKHKTR
jgi:hypothetical protein